MRELCGWEERSEEIMTRKSLFIICAGIVAVLTIVGIRLWTQPQAASEGVEIVVTDGSTLVPTQEVQQEQQPVVPSTNMATVATNDVEINAVAEAQLNKMGLSLKRTAKMTVK